jgi:nucleotide-binding universal stress UspA family protein
VKTLIAIDSSAASDAVISGVAARPWPAHSSFEVLSVAESSDEDALLKMTAVAENGVTRLCASNLDASAFAVRGNPKTAIVERAKEIAANLIVIGSSHGSGLQHLLLGDVPTAVIRHAHCSVEVVRPIGDISRGMKILLATDGSDDSQAAARAIASRPRPAGSEVRVLTAVELSLTMLESTLEPPYVNNEMLEMQRAQAMKRAEAAIAGAEEILQAAGMKTSQSISVLVEGPGKIILDEAKAWGADLIVVGSHGHRGLDRLLLGSVSEAVATQAECSVEVVRS